MRLQVHIEAHPVITLEAVECVYFDNSCGAWLDFRRNFGREVESPGSQPNTATLPELVNDDGVVGVVAMASGLPACRQQTACYSEALSLPSTLQEEIF